jgi:hypothetical protein
MVIKVLSTASIITVIIINPYWWQHKTYASTYGLRSNSYRNSCNPLILTKPNSRYFSWGIRDKWLPNCSEHLPHDNDPKPFVYKHFDTHPDRCKNGAY